MSVLADIFGERCESRRPALPAPNEQHAQCILDREHAGMHIASGGEWSDFFAGPTSSHRCRQRVGAGTCELLIGHPAAHARHEEGVLVRW